MMVAKIIDGKNLALQIRADVASKIFNLEMAPHLAVILVGNDEASLIYDRNKQKAANAIGMECDLFHLEEKTSEAELLKLIDKLNLDNNINGILVQLPLPEHINSRVVIEKINPSKDVDGFSPCNAGLLQAKDDKAIIAATPKGILYLLQSVCDDLSGKNVVIIGRSNIVGRPMASLLLNHDCTVTITHSKTKNLSEITKRADIVISACGYPKMVKKDWISKGAIVIDVGINRSEGKICGDVDFAEVSEVASYITPVPGGVGPMTVAMLLQNTYEAFLNQNTSLKK